MREAGRGVGWWGAVRIGTPHRSGWRGRRGLEGTHRRKLTARGAEGNGMGGGIRARAVSFRSSHRAVFHVCLPFWERSGGEGLWGCKGNRA